MKLYPRDSLKAAYMAREFDVKIIRGNYEAKQESETYIRNRKHFFTPEREDD